MVRWAAVDPLLEDWTYHICHGGRQERIRLILRTTALDHKRTHQGIARYSELSSVAKGQKTATGLGGITKLQWSLQCRSLLYWRDGYR